MKQQAERLFRAVGGVGDDLIVRADEPVKRAPRVWIKWAALAACCALVIGAAALVLPMFRAGSCAPETAALTSQAAPEAAQTMEAPDMEEAAPAEEPAQMLETESAAESAVGAGSAETRTLPGADCFTVLPDSVTRTAADITLTDETGAVLALADHYWLERLENGEWKPLEADTPQAARTQDEAAAPGAAVCTLHYDWSEIYGALPDGEYRLMQPVILADETDETLCAAFTVK